MAKKLRGGLMKATALAVVLLLVAGGAVLAESNRAEERGLDCSGIPAMTDEQRTELYQIREEFREQLAEARHGRNWEEMANLRSQMWQTVEEILIEEQLEQMQQKKMNHHERRNTQRQLRKQLKANQGG